MSKISKNNLKVSSILLEFINNEVIPGTDIIADEFWSKFDRAVHELAPINKSLIKNKGRLLVRPSGTEPKIRIMCESFNNSLIDKCINIIKKTIN